jgi:tetratricopeptide (TPR) repeat protein
MSTIALGMIVKDEVDNVLTIINDSLVYLDHIYITVSDKKAYNKIKKHYFHDGQEKFISVDYRAWNDRFDEARQHNFNQVKEDFYLWLDADDTFAFPTIPDLVDKMDQEQIDALWLPYEYAYDADGNVIALHWRERIVRRSKGWTWRGWVHENLLTEQQVKSERVNVPVKHQNHDDQKSAERNLKILQKAYKETDDPRYIHYYGITLFSMGQWQEAIDVLKEYVMVGGWDEEIYRSLLRMSDASLNLGKKEDALQYASRASILLPDYPDAYFSLAQIEFDDENWKAVTEWLKVAFSKQRPDSASITDPTVPDKARLIGAMAEFQLKNYREAAELLDTVKTMDVSDLKPEFERQASIDRAAAVLPALAKHYETPSTLWHGLKKDLQYDNRFRKFREMVTEPHTWPKKSVVIFCGQGYEEWGPHTLDKGMGGSEEAVVYLSGELARLGYAVTVFGEVKKPLQHGEVFWYPWTHIDKRDTFDTLIIWRYPQYVNQFKARKKLIDMHDLLPEKLVKPYPDATYMFKSSWMAEQYPQITNFKIISNGIKEQYNG